MLRRDGRGLVCALLAIAACDVRLDAGYNRALVEDAGRDGQPTPPVFTLNGASVNLVLNGNATLANGHIVLTEAAENQQGTAFLPAPLAIAAATRIDVQLVFQIDPSAIAADGVALVFHADAMGAKALGGEGGGLSIGQLSPSLAVVFDTHDGTSFEMAPGVLIGRGASFATTPIAARPAPFPLAMGNRVFVWVSYQAGRLQVFVADTPARPAAPYLEAAVDLRAELGAQAFLGVAAATGAKYSRHVVQALQVVIGP